MKIAINCIFFQPKAGGIREYILNLVNNLIEVDSQNSYIIYVLRDQEEYAREKLPQGITIKSIPFSSQGVANRVLRSIFSSIFWLLEERRERFDIFHSPFFHAPSLRRAKVVLTLHDLRFYRYPKTYSFMRRLYLKRVVPRSLRRCDHIITISDFTKQELLEAYEIPLDKITTIHEAVDRSRFAKRVDTSVAQRELPQPLHSEFILSVSHIEPRKNYARLVEAFNILRSDYRYEKVELVIVGQATAECRAEVEMFRQTEGLHYLNFVSEDLLIWLYTSARVFVFPSYYEGFGFPPLEAGCAGCVTAVSNLSVMPEVCGRGAIYFNPYDVLDISGVVSKALRDNTLREETKKAMRKNLFRFSWRKNAEQTLEVYRAVQNRSKRIPTIKKAI